MSYPESLKPLVDIFKEVNMVTVAPYPFWSFWSKRLGNLSDAEIKGLLASGVDSGFLSKHYEWSDGLECFEALPEEITFAEENGFLVHPHSGYPVYDWEDLVSECYRPTQKVREIWEEANKLKLAALDLYKPPFVYHFGYIHDANGEVVADQDGVEGAIALQIRGWGHIQYHKEVDPEALQDLIGEMTAQAMTKHWKDMANAWKTSKEG